MHTEVNSRIETGAHVHLKYVDGSWETVPAVLPQESALSLLLNGQDLVTIQCTPEKLNCLVIGYLASQGLVSSPDDIAMMSICPDELVADVRLKGAVVMPTRRVLTSGCGGGVSFDIGKSLSPVRSQLRVSSRQVLSAMGLLLRAEADNTDGRKKGVHLSALSDGDKLFAAAEDIGRHNTVDKVWGECISCVKFPDCSEVPLIKEL